MKLLAILSVFSLMFLVTGCNEENDTVALRQNNKIKSPFEWPKINEGQVGECKPITKAQMNKIDSVSIILFSGYEKINEYPESLEFVYSDATKFTRYILEFVTIERICCPEYTFYVKIHANSTKVSLIVGGSPHIKELAKEYVQ